MWKKIAIAAAGTAAIVGVGTAALAESGTGSPAAGLAQTASPTGSTTAGAPAAKHAKNGKHVKGGLLKVGAVAHASWVTKDGAKFVTHDAIHGSVTAVTATSITVKAGDGVSQTYSVTGSTKVRVRTAGTAKGAAGTIASVKTGQIALVTGTGTTALSAAHIVTGLKK